MVYFGMPVCVFCQKTLKYLDEAKSFHSASGENLSGIQKLDFPKCSEAVFKQQRLDELGCFSNGSG